MHGSGGSQIIISNSEVYALICIAIVDLGWSYQELDVVPIGLPSTNYYDINISWFEEIEFQWLSANNILDALGSCIERDNDFSLYIENLSALHRRRAKYKRILSRQPLPTMDQIGPRVLLEYRCCNVGLLAHWMVWRKWIYDIDNRSAQETGYLFEPILASCLGGEPVGARNSPIKRLDSEGNQTLNGRQIDCLIPANGTAYELKLRVTIAASGQGRFSEELSFPRESQVAGYRPILLVLDPNPSSRLAVLSEAFLMSGGEFYQGEDAWNHMEQQAGSVVSRFIEKYIKPAIQDIESIDISSIKSLTLAWDNNGLTIASENDTYSINRL
ncbi:MAG: restriction endonuclease [Leptolyngbya sp.]|nr:MAG: restriction endonuclease [Leptolyngbya sp.]